MEYANMDGSVDGRGVVRGKCKNIGCPCTRYNGGCSKKLCLYCGHPPSGPGGHEKLSTSFEVGSPMETGDISEMERPVCFNPPCTNYVYCDSQMNFEYCTPKCRDDHILKDQHEILEQDLRRMQEDLRTRARDYASQSTEHRHENCTSKLPSTEIPKCSNPQCNNHVYYDLRQPLMFFKYCTPRCRDDHILKTEQENLECDLKRMEEDLAVKYKPTPQSAAHSHETDAQNPSSPNDVLEVPKCADSTKAAQKRQVTTRLVIQKPMMDQDFGIIVCYHSKKELIITGVKTGSLAHQKMKSGEIQFLSRITKYNSNHPYQEVSRVIEALRKSQTISLELDHIKGVEFPTEYFDVIEKETTHFIILTYSVDHPKYGIRLNEMLKVCEVTKDSPAMNNGVKENDTLVAAYNVNKKEPITLSIYAFRPRELLQQEYSMKYSTVLALHRCLAT